MYVGRWSYGTKCAFNSSSFPSFKQIVHVIGKFGAFYYPPSSYELRENISQKRWRQQECLLRHKKLSTS